MKGVAFFWFPYQSEQIYLLMLKLFMIFDDVNWNYVIAQESTIRYV